MPTVVRLHPTSGPPGPAVRRPAGSIDVRDRPYAAHPHIPESLPAWARTFLLAERAAINVPDVVELVASALQEGETVLHAHFLSPPGVVAALALQEVRRPAVLELHGYDIFRVARAHPDAAAEVMSAFDCVIANCLAMEEAASNLIDRLPPKRRPALHLVYHGIDVHHVSRLARSANVDGSETRRPRVVSIGRLVEKKGMAHLLAAWPAVVERYASAVLEIVGEGPEMSHLRALSRSLAVDHNVRFWGQVGRAQAIALTRSADLFALACVESETGDMDGTPNVLMEAQLLGVPVVATRIGGIPDIVIDGRTGVLVDAADPRDLSVALLGLLRKPDVRRQMGHVGRRWVQAHLNMTTVMPTYWDLYSQAEARSRPV